MNGLSIISGPSAFVAVLTPKSTRAVIYARSWMRTLEKARLSTSVNKARRAGASWSGPRAYLDLRLARHL